MDPNSGRIYEVDAKEHEEALKKRAEKESKIEAYGAALYKAMDKQRFHPVPLTDREARFFKTKGLAFRQLWGKRIDRGLTREQKEQLAQLVLEFEKANGL